MDFLHRIDRFISKHKLINETDTLLVTVSGGMDSMFLVHYFITNNYKIAVAHCNFRLRGMESDLDEQLVKSYCEAKKVKLHVMRFETDIYSKDNGISTQMAARDLRYHWFNELCQAENYTKIVTAHHKTDNIETILLNQLRGTGLKGLEGISVVSGNKIRPLLCLTRDEIEKVVKELSINYREDSSNQSNKYQRNRLRLNVLPELKKINPDFENTFQANAEIARQANGFIHFFMDKIKKEIVVKIQNSTFVSIEKLVNLPEPKFVLFNILAELGFKDADVEDIFKSLTDISGKQFFSTTHRLVKDREQLIIEPILTQNLQTVEIHEKTKAITTPHHYWHFQILTSNFQIPNSNFQAHLDFEKLKFPLTIRPWQNGDKIKPLGMKGYKKVSDILIDKKLSLLDKEKTWVIFSGNEIAWVSKLVVSDDFKINPETIKVLLISLKPI